MHVCCVCVGGTQLPNRTPRLRLASAVYVDDQKKKQERKKKKQPGQINFGRLLTMGNAATIFNLSDRTEHERKEGRQTVTHRQDRSLLPLPTRYMHPNTAVCRRKHAAGVRTRRHTVIRTKDPGPRTQGAGPGHSWTAGQTD